MDMPAIKGELDSLPNPLPTNHAYSIHSEMPAHRFIERELIRQLLIELGALGWFPARFECDGDKEYIANPADTWKVFEQYDEGFLIFRKKGSKPRWVFLVGGNGDSVISDYQQAIDWNGAFDRVYLR